MAIKGKSFLTSALLFMAGGGLSGCVYDVGLGYASDGYYDDEYGCDPSGGYDAYYECDYGHAFGKIGFAGGWFGNYYYPGHGVFLFDNVGRRYPMREQYRRYWGERRHNWYREHRGRDWGGGGGPNADAVPAPQRRGSSIQEKAPSIEQLPEPSREPQDRPARRQRVPEGGEERPD